MLALGGLAILARDVFRPPGASLPLKSLPSTPSAARLDRLPGGKVLAIEVRDYVGKEIGDLTGGTRYVVDPGGSGPSTITTLPFSIERTGPTLTAIFADGSLGIAYHEKRAVVMPGVECWFRSAAREAGATVHYTTIVNQGLVGR